MILKLANSAHCLFFLQENQYQRGNPSQMWHLGRQGSGFGQRSGFVVLVWTPLWPNAADLSAHWSQIKHHTASQQLPSDLRPVPLVSCLPQHCSKLFWGQWDEPVQRDLSGGWMTVGRQPVDLCGPFWPYPDPGYKHTNTSDGCRNRSSHQTIYTFVQS